MISPQTAHDSTAGDDSEPGALYLDTIALLQDEISRLESELQARRQDDLEPHVSPEPAGNAGATALLQQDLDRTRLEVSTRDETISFLLEQLRLIEEAESASRAEWEKLALWVSEVEERVEGQDLGKNRRDEEELAELRRAALEDRSQLEHERETWAAERRRLEEEAGRLQALLVRAAAADCDGEPGAATAIEALESENCRLRQSYMQLEQTSRAESQDLRAKAEAAQRQLAALRKEFELVKDQCIRERREHETAMASHRASLSRASLSRASLAAGEEAHVAHSSKEEADHQEPLDVDLRIRAFRQHLKEIHHHEAETRNQNRLSARLSRLWSRTTPKG
jgi:hypothetical protein